MILTNKYFTFFVVLLSVLYSCTVEVRHPEIESGWKLADSILDSFNPPVFPEKDFSITEFGAEPNGNLCTDAFKLAIETCNKNGGGRVVVPAGVFYTGAIRLLSNVNLHLDSGAVVKFSTNPKDYLPMVLTRFEGMELYNFSPLIYSYGCENVAVSGDGILDGQGAKDNWWMWKRATKEEMERGVPSQKEPNSKPLLLKMMNEGVPVKKRKFGDGHFLRSSFIQMYRCKNVLIEGITLKRPPMWMIHPVLSKNITVRNVKLFSPDAPNGDGFDPECCENILVEKCVFNTGDDCIAIKSGRNRQGYDAGIPSKNIIIRDCKMMNGHGGVVIGSELSGGVENVFVYNCEMSSPHLERALRIKSNRYRGGYVMNVFMKNIKIGQISNAAIRINQNYFENTPWLPVRHTVIENIFIKNMVCNKGEYALQIMGTDEMPVKNIKIINCRFEHIEKDNALTGVKNLLLDNVTINNKLKNLKID